MKCIIKTATKQITVDTVQELRKYTHVLDTLDIEYSLEFIREGAIKK